MLVIRGSGPEKGAEGLGRQHHTAEEIINKLREAEVGLAKGLAVPEVCRKLGVAEQTYYRWRKEYGGLRRQQATACRLFAGPARFWGRSDRRSGGGVLLPTMKGGC